MGGYDRYVHSCRRLILSTEAECLSRVSVAGLLLKERRDGNYDGAALQVVGEGWLGVGRGRWQRPARLWRGCGPWGDGMGYW